MKQVELILYLELDPLPSTSPLDLYIVLSPLTIYLHLCLDLNTSTSFTGKKKLYFSEKKSIHNDLLNIYDQVELILYLELDPLPSTSPLDLYIVLSPLTSPSTSAST